MKTELLGCITVEVPINPNDYTGIAPLRKFQTHFIPLTQAEVPIFKKVFKIGDLFENQIITSVEVRD